MPNFSDVNLVTQKENLEGIKTLPLSHNCNFHHVEGILNKKKIEAKDCNIFNDKLAYFFYGKPSYFKEAHKIPVFLLFEFKDLKTEHRIAPFDTGAYYNGLLDGVKKESIEDGKDSISLDKFCYLSKEGENSEDYNKNVISYFFDDNLNYYDNSIKDDIEHYNACSLHYEYIAVEGLYSKDYDDRATSIEVQFRDDFSIERNKLIYAFIPRDMAKAWTPKLKNINKDVQIEVYLRTKLSGGVTKMAGIANQAIKRFLESKNLL
ncbi:hypothetical protein [Tenacibaculum agarivorans]|uniref:hypothetical protein n=1 Tax=Tenacibaculum agarivorans TaxID=1908389 RepID=UPI000AC753A6|nr:hypothetical protein [Tenacibaculum agarivorans]